MKLIENTVGGRNTTQLFDTVADPFETRDLSASTAHTADLARLRKELARWQEAIDDPLRPKAS